MDSAIELCIQENPINENICKICFEEREELNFIFCLKCRNKLCNTCYGDYIKQNNESCRCTRCPFCRVVLVDAPEPVIPPDSITVSIESRRIIPIDPRDRYPSTLYSILAIERLVNCICAGFTGLLVTMYFYLWASS